jgi:acetyltransferase-like isoleucine patch superfamily enzyme
LLRAREPLLHPELYDIGDQLTMGRYSYGSPLVRRFGGDDPSTRVRIGQFVSIADDVVILAGGEHPTERVSSFPFSRCEFGTPGEDWDGFPRSRGDIVIGNDVWIGRGTRILSGVTVGDGAVIGGYSVVAKDVRPYAIVVGNPAREVRRRFSDEQIEALLRIRWWDWSDDELAEAVPLLDSAQIEEFLERYAPARGAGAQPSAGA